MIKNVGQTITKRKWDATLQVFSLALARIPDATLQMLSLALARNVLDTRLQTFSLALAHILDATLQICGGMITQHANTMAS